MAWWNRSLSWAAHRDGDAPGWEALERALEDARAGEPVHFPTGAKPGAPGAYAVNAYRIDDDAEGPLWLLVSWGLSDLFEPSARPIPAEITLRLPRTNGAGEPPVWARLLLDALVLHQRQAGAAPQPGDLVELGAPVDGSRKTKQVALVYAADPQLGQAHSMLGTVQFAAALAIDAEQVGAAKALGGEAMLARLADDNPRWVSRLTR